MACDINGSGCKVCPGMWIAVLLFLILAVQGLFFRPTTANISSADLPSPVQQAKSTPASSE